MPTSLFSEMERGNKTLEDQRALELAYNLQTMSMFLNNDNNECVTNYDMEPRSKKSQNTTECVPVPSSEHVAEIVGRQGCKIKALRAKTNTYIKTPVRGEEPVFVVTGRKEDVNAAKREILSAAEHFSQIRAQRKNNLNGAIIPGPNSNIPGQTTIQVRVPYRVVGLVVGPKGATIKRIQQTTSTYIVTPSRDKEPIFEVTGLPDNVESARKEIEAHIAMRTGGSVDDGDEYNANPMECFTNNLNAINVGSLFKNDMNSPFILPFSRDSNNLLDMDSSNNLFSYQDSKQQNDLFNNGFSNNFGRSRFGYNSYDTDEGLGDSPTYDFGSTVGGASSWPDFSSSSTLTDSGMSVFGSNSSSSSNNERSNSISGAITDYILGDHPPARRIHSDPISVAEVGDLLSDSLFTAFSNGFPPSGGGKGVANSSSSSSIESLAPGKKPQDSLLLSKRDCIACFESAIVAALVPCGHNFFCMECANRICKDTEGECPVCHQPVSQAIRIYN